MSQSRFGLSRAACTCRAAGRCPVCVAWCRRIELDSDLRNIHSLPDAWASQHEDTEDEVGACKKA